MSSGNLLNLHSLDPYLNFPTAVNYGKSSRVHILSAGMMLTMDKPKTARGVHTQSPKCEQDIGIYKSVV